MIVVPLYKEQQRIGRNKVIAILGRFPRNTNSPKLSWTYELECSCGKPFIVNQEWIKRKLRNHRVIKCDECSKLINKETKLFINWGYNPRLPMSEW